MQNFIHEGIGELDKVFRISENTAIAEKALQKWMEYLELS